MAPLSLGRGQVILSWRRHSALSGSDWALGSAPWPCSALSPSVALLWPAVTLCGSLGPSLWPSLDRRPAAPHLCSCRCALAAPIGCSSRPGAGRLSSPPLQAPARDASKSCQPADHPLQRPSISSIPSIHPPPCQTVQTTTTAQ